MTHTEEQAPLGFPEVADSKGLKTGALGLVSSVVVGMASTAPAYSLAASLGFVVATTNTGAATLNLNSIGAKTIKKKATQDVSAGDLLAGTVADVYYDGTYFQLVSKAYGAAPAFAVYRGGNQAVSNATNTQVFLQAEEFDTDAAYDNVTNYRFQPGAPGYYWIDGQIVGYASGGSLTLVLATIRKNLTTMRSAYQSVNFNATSSSVNVSALVQLNGTTDYVTLWGQVAGASGQAFLGGQSETFLQGYFVRPL